MSNKTASGNPKKPRRVAPRFDLIPPGPLRRLAARYALGLHYGRDSWRNGLDLDDAFNHALEHLLTYGERLRLARADQPDTRRDDDDLAAVAWAMFTLMEYQDKEKR